MNGHAVAGKTPAITQFEVITFFTEMFCMSYPCIKSNEKDKNLRREETLK